MTLTPSVEDGAQEIVDEKFDEHVAIQKENFLVDDQQEESKRHGKLRTKHDRLVIPLHYLDALCEHWVSERARLGGALDLEGLMFLTHVFQHI